MTVHFLSSGEKKAFIRELNEKYGVETLNYIFSQSGKEKIRGFSGTMSREELTQLSEFARVEFAGLYFARRESFGLRLSFDAIHLLSKEITKGVAELTYEQSLIWMSGSSLELDLEPGIYIVRSGEDFIGCGHATGGRLHNYVPKERQVKLKV